MKSPFIIRRIALAFALTTTTQQALADYASAVREHAAKHYEQACAEFKLVLS